ncbi:MAG: hemerythrin domain-containing protein [Bacteroidetes bacterium]|nr:MAG: hemerythrin domain-containing protein [Bacteroidota bacterium]
METNQPIVRSNELSPLSREHHDGLLFVWKLRQGLSNNIAPARLKDFTIFYWQQHIKPHFYQEEHVLSKFIPTDNPLLKQMQEEHSLIRELILSLGDDASIETFTSLADVIYKHIRFEERELFGWVEVNLNKEQLEEIYKELEEHPLCGSDWKDEFWLKK